jgi:hypothetical protein
MTRTFGGNPNQVDSYLDKDGNPIFQGTFEEHHVIPQEIFNNSSGLHTDKKDFLLNDNLDAQRAQVVA